MNEFKIKNNVFKIPRIISKSNEKPNDINIKIKNIKGERFSSIDEFKRKLESSHSKKIEKNLNQQPSLARLLSPLSNYNNTLTSFKLKNHSIIPNNDYSNKNFQPNSTSSEFNPMKTIYSNQLYTDNFDQEIKPLTSYYFVNGFTKNYYKRQEEYVKGNKKKFLKKYKISHDQKVIEELVIIVN